MDGASAPEHEGASKVEPSSLLSALAKAQAEIGRAEKDGNNKHFGSNYATLASVMDACMPALSKHGIAVTQPLVYRGEQPFIITRLHYGATGETLEDDGIPLLVDRKGGMQPLGSAQTYARRYGLMGMAGVAPADDDDGNSAQEATAPRQRQEPPKKEGPPEPFTPEQAATKRDAMKQALDGSKTGADINGLVANARFKGDFARLPEPMQAEVRAYTAERRAAVAPPPERDDSAHPPIDDEIPY